MNVNLFTPVAAKTGHPLMTADRFKAIVDAISGGLMYVLLSFAPFTIAAVGTFAIIHGYILGKIPIEGAVTQLGIVYAAVGTLSASKILLKTKASELASKSKPVEEMVGLPQTMALMGVQKQEEQAAALPPGAQQKRQTGDVLIPDSERQTTQLPITKDGG